MSDFENFIMMFLIPIVYVVAYIAGKCDIFGQVLVSLKKSLERLTKGNRIIDADIWIDRLKTIVCDPEAPGELKDYYKNLINEIETETNLQEGK